MTNQERGAIGDGRYLLVRQIASGGMGTIWQGRDTRLNRTVAIKEVSLDLVPPILRGEFLERAVLEGRNAAALADHPNIVTVHDVVVEDGAPWTVMQFVRGRSLAEVLRAGPIPVDQATVLAGQLLSALGFAHQVGIVHRDVKPLNIMINDGDGRALLADFGIAKNDQDTGITRTGVVIGSAPYMAPERHEGESGGPASDLFSLGVTLFEAVEGYSPFAKDSRTGTVTAILVKPLPAMRRADKLAPLITALTDKDPARRPSMARASQLLHGGSMPRRQPGTTALETAPATTPSTTPPPPVVSTPGPSSVPPQPRTASTNNPAHLRRPATGRNRAALERFGPPAVLTVLLTVMVTKAIETPLFDVTRYAGGGIRLYVYTLAITLAVTAALTPRSRVLTRGIGYVTAVLAAISVNLISTDNRPLCYVTTVLIIAAYCYRDNRTRRARSAYDASDSVEASTGRLASSVTDRDSAPAPSLPARSRLRRRTVVLGGVAALTTASGATALGLRLANSPDKHLWFTLQVDTRVGSVAFSPDGTSLASGEGEPDTDLNDGKVCLWNLATRTNTATMTGTAAAIVSVAFSPDGKTLAACSDDDTNNPVQLWDPATHAVTATLPGYTANVYTVAFSPDSKTLATGSSDHAIRLWDLATRTTTATLNATDQVTSVAFSPDGKTLASGSYDSTVALWDLTTRTHIATLAGHTESVESVAFSPDGKTLASGSDDGSIRLWDVATHINTATLTGTDIVCSVAFSPDGKTLASGGGDKTIRLWDVATNTNTATLTGHTLTVLSVAFSPDGKTLASGSVDKTIRLWKPS